MIPDDMMLKQTAHAFHLRSRSKSGEKDWIGIVSHDPMYGGKLWVVNGQTKHVLSGGGAGRAVKAPGTEQALSEAVNRKLAEGYTLVDEYEGRYGCWNSQMQPTKLATPTSSPQRKPPTPRPAAKPATTLSNPDKEDAEPTMCW